MHFRSTGGNVNLEGNPHPDSGSVLLPNRISTKNTIVRKPIAPLASTPPPGRQSGNFTSFINKSTNTIPPSIPQMQRPVAPRTISPFSEKNDDSTAHKNISKPVFDPMRPFRNNFLGKQAANADPPETSDPKGKEKDQVNMDESLERARENKLSAKAREIRAWMMGKSGSEMHRSALDAFKKTVGNNDTSHSARMRQTVGGVRDLFKSRRPVPPPKDQEGPKPGQTYEMIHYELIEDNSERTVEVSTYKEQALVERAKTTDCERMSIYYLSADEIPLEDDYSNNEPVTGAGQRMNAPTLPPEQHRRSGNSGFGRLVNAEISQKERKNSHFRQQRSMTSESVRTPQRERTISPSTSEIDRSLSTKEHFVDVVVNHVDIHTGGSSTPVKQTAHRSLHQRRRDEYIPIQKDISRSPPFQPTRSGSTISSIRSNSAMQFEDILQSCQPSLVHIAPVLRSLGIQKIEHLKAIFRLSPLIRDREIKENALGQGITVLEWAVLLDKISTL